MPGHRELTFSVPCLLRLRGRAASEVGIVGSLARRKPDGPLTSTRAVGADASHDAGHRDQNTNLRPICSSRIGFLVLVIAP